MAWLGRIGVPFFAVVLALLASVPGAQASDRSAVEPIRNWYRLTLELVRHTPTYSPPVASRALAYLGISAFESLASGDPRLKTLAGQLNELDALPAREAGLHAEAVIVQAAMAEVIRDLFANTGPTGQRAIAAFERKLRAEATAGLAADVVDRSEAHGQAIAAHILAWSRTDGGAVIENMGFPATYQPRDVPDAWVPTSLVAQQQAPLLPGWGSNRTFAMPHGAACGIAPPPAYGEAPDSAFYREAAEVHRAVLDLTPEQRLIARFWADDPMLSPTPPGHWIAIALQALREEGADAARFAETLALIGIGMADAFIGCWDAKFKYDLVRPITYIRRVIDPAWEPILNTPPFPEYPSGHSTQSGAAATVLTGLFGDDHAFEDTTHVDDGLPVRSYGSFWDAAHEAGMSRLFGGIHFRSAIDRGLEQGRCIGAFVNALQTRR
ncbi:phosphatase PAP2 family protein [Aquibium carbonis]|uniref:Phosphatase PAP2 family protein n=1 Tax=Aquibium carbonis TaxID=2495581 RepID=A0A3R9YR68_9HYPH|nr:vanadium-dependent haloperoxidase [Aquibium carbonis]RST85082.1 phosphatase PAP2 family protein [Aquibium carbonis]